MKILIVNSLQFIDDGKYFSYYLQVLPFLGCNTSPKALEALIDIIEFLLISVTSTCEQELMLGRLVLNLYDPSIVKRSFS
jgi:hypothetical protein